MTPIRVPPRVVEALTRGLSPGGFAIEVDRHGTIVHWNEGAERLWGRPAGEALGQSLASVSPDLDVVRASGRDDPAGLARRLVNLPLSGAPPVEVVVSPISRRGRRAGVWLIGRVPDGAPSEPVRDQVRGLAPLDAFTAAVAAALRQGTMPTVVVVDVGGLDAVNQTIGHQAGDRLLEVLAARLRSVIAPGDVGACFSRRFAVLVDAGGRGDLQALGRSLSATLGGLVDLGPTSMQVGITVGAAQARPGEDAATVLRHADLAVAAALATGSGYELYDPLVHRSVEARLEREVDLRSAVSRGEFVVHYQPVVDLRLNTLVGAEALIRWRRASGELVMPGEFIGMAETSGAIVGIGLWVLQEACRQTRDWSERYRPGDPLEVAVNLSVRQLSSTALTGDIADVLGGVGIDPGTVTLEVTESSLMDDPENMIRRLDELRDMGLTLSMDDFGTGYSSLSYLRQLPIDVVKIDRSFVGGVARSDEEWALAVAIVRLATSLGKRTLAEGVETPAQLAHLRALHCDLGQGFLFSRPLPPDRFEALLRDGAWGAPPGTGR